MSKIYKIEINVTEIICPEVCLLGTRVDERKELNGTGLPLCEKDNSY